ncbi:MAG: hypothetical protein K2M39_08370 [Muribaculaceae bacterium]|nr:hypothetical protein [Muribaculaceae bacterium]
MKTKTNYKVIYLGLFLILTGCGSSVQSSKVGDDSISATKAQSVSDFSEEGKTMLFSDQRYKWYYTPENNDLPKAIYVYDSESNSIDSISVNKTRLDSNDVKILGIVENNGRISVIMENTLLGKNAVDKTNVWTIDCASREWHPVAQDISSAEFSDNGKSVKLNQVEFRITDWENPGKKKRINTSLTVPLDFASSEYSSSDVDMIDMAYEKVALTRDDRQVKKYFTSNGLRQLKDDYDYDCPDDDCYGTWSLTTGAQDSAYENCPSNRVIGINPDKKGGYTVIYFESGYFGATQIKVKDGKIDYYETVLSPWNNDF